MSVKDFNSELQAEEKQGNPSRHILLLYDDEESLANVLRASEDLTKKDWFRTYCGSESHAGIKFLKTQGWSDMTLSPYSRLLDDTKQYFSDVWDRIINEAEERRTCTMGFMTGDLCRQSSLRNAVKVEESYNDSNGINGIIYCPYMLKDLLNGGAADILDLVRNHDQSFLVQKDKLHKIG